MPEAEEQYHVREVGVETEEDAERLSQSAQQEAFITGSDWTTETLVTQLRKGNIELNPGFQRREVWNRFRKSKLIESIILNLPIPQIILAERKDRRNTYVVLDGKQRLLTIRQFCVNQDDDRDQTFDPLFLQRLPVLTDLNGQTYHSLVSEPIHSHVVDAFDNHTIRTVVIRQWPNEDYLFRVFRRLNTGSVPLSSQELRQALKPGPFTDFCDEFASSNNEIQRALGISKPDFRMRDNEVFLRYMAFAMRAEYYGGNLKWFLDDTAGVLNKRWADEEAEIRAVADSCEESIAATFEVFGTRDAFCIYVDEAFGRRFNRAVFDVMTFYFRERDVREAAIGRKLDVKQAFIDRSKRDYEFFQALTTTTKSMKATATRFVGWAGALESVLGIPVKPPNAFIRVLEET